MIALPAGWLVVHGADRIELLHPGGAEIASIEYCECLRPLARVGVLIRRELAEVPSFAPKELPDCVERLTTFEGEYGALATIAGGHDAHAAQLNLGFVFGDDFYARTSALCCRSQLFDDMTALVRKLVVTDSHALGIRRRRFDYASPREWQPIIRRFITDWIPPGYPNDAIHLTVYPANPTRFTRREICATLVGGGRIEPERDLKLPITTSSGLSGDLFELAYRVDGRRVVKLSAILADERYSYAIDVTADREERISTHREEIDRVIASIRPIPIEQPLRADDRNEALMHWLD
jgi:hypothetical protein